MQVNRWSGAAAPPWDWLEGFKASRHSSALLRIEVSSLSPCPSSKPSSRKSQACNRGQVSAGQGHTPQHEGSERAARQLSLVWD